MAARGVSALVVALVLVAAPAGAGAATRPPVPSRATVMTYNLYLGADLTPLFGASGTALITAAGTVYGHVIQVDFPDRATEVARLIAEKAPDVVGLQEVALWKTAPATLTALGPVCPDASAFATSVDYLTTLRAKLALTGHPYRAVVVSSNFSGTLPISFTTCASFTDRDVILVRSDVPPWALSVGDTDSGTYEAGMNVPLNDTFIKVPRGWAWADVTVGRKTFRFFDTHLEAYANGVRDAQAAELTEVMAESPHPVVAVGDFNTTPSESSGAYGILAGSGLVDSWPEAMGTAPGYTSGQSDDLDNVPSQISHRIDLIWHSGGRATLRAVRGSGDVVGDAVTDMTTTVPPLWPSDHAGVAMTLHVAQP